MGLFANTVRSLVPERKTAIAASVPTWESGNPMTPPSTYYRNAREGYMLDEIVYDCIEFRATSAGEPPIVAYRHGSDEKLDQHPAVALLNNPNPFMGRARFWATLSMFQDIGGNAYVEKVRSAAGRVVELWPLRPDRLRVVPSRERFIGGYLYEIGDVPPHVFPPEDIIHFKTRHPLDDFYGLPPLAVIAGRVDLDVWVRHFTEAFFRNAGVPAGLLNIVSRTVNLAERENIRRNFREIYGGPDGWHRLMVLDGGQATYTPMGLPLGADGLALGDLNDINETRIMGVYGVLPSLIPSMAGSKSGNLAGGNRESDRQLFWESTMIPLFIDLDSSLTMGLADEFPDLDRLEHDLSKVKALQEDEDKKNDRYIKRWQAGVITWPEVRTHLGEPEKPAPGMLVLPSNSIETWSETMLKEPEPEPVPALPGGAGAALPAPPAPAANGQRNGSGAY